MLLGYVEQTSAYVEQTSVRQNRIMAIHGDDRKTETGMIE